MNIRIQDLSMTYPNGKQALSHLNLELKAPSMIGLLGPNGAGKSTLMKLLTAALVPSNGSTSTVYTQCLKICIQHMEYSPQSSVITPFAEATVNALVRRITIGHILPI